MCMLELCRHRKGPQKWTRLSQNFLQTPPANFSCPYAHLCVLYLAFFLLLDINCIFEHNIIPHLLYIFVSDCLIFFWTIQISQCWYWVYIHICTNTHSIFSHHWKYIYNTNILCRAFHSIHSRSIHFNPCSPRNRTFWAPILHIKPILEKSPVYIWDCKRK